MCTGLQGMKLSFWCYLIWRVFIISERLQPITAAAMWTVAINVLEPLAFNSESQYFIPLFNKISWLCRQQPGGDEASNERCNSGPTGHDFTDDFIMLWNVPCAGNYARIVWFKLIRSWMEMTSRKNLTTLISCIFA